MAVKLASIFNGEIISSDSRQVYKGIDIGVGKDLDEYNLIKNGKLVKIPYHLIDVIDINYDFNLKEYKDVAEGKIKEVDSRDKLPFLAGGSGLYIDAVIKDYKLSNEKKDSKLRQKMNSKGLEELLQILKEIDKNKQFIDKIDINNKRRVVRAIEMIKNNIKPQRNPHKKYDYLLIGKKYSIEEIRTRIRKRQEKMFNEGLIDEVDSLVKKNIGEDKINELGFEYRYVYKYLKGEIDETEMKEIMAIKTGQYAKRQLTWFKRNKKINWVKDISQAKRLIKDFL